MKILAMILAGGKGTRLEALTKRVAKPAVSFAAKYRIIDFPLSNCANSGIDAVGVLTQYESTFLDSYLGNGEKWGFNGARTLMSSLAPRQTEAGAQWYRGTADAITQNIEFIDEQNPDYVLILSGDHIYKTRFNDMIKLHCETNADVTISVIEVDWAEASRFGIMSVDKKDQIIKFDEKPKVPKSNLASMGIYCFSWKILRKYLKDDANNEKSSHDFGKDIIPTMLKDKRKLQAYRYQGYWRDVGTIASLHQANMDLLDQDEFHLYGEDEYHRLYTEDKQCFPSYIGPVGSIKHSIANQGAIILGNITDCVVSDNVLIEEDCVLTRCVVMSGAVIKRGAKINNAIIAPDTHVSEDAKINLKNKEVILISGKN